MPSRKIWIGFLNLTASLTLIVSCNQTPPLLVKSAIETKILALIKSIKNSRLITKKYGKNNFLGDKNAYYAIHIFKKYGIVINFSGKTSSANAWIGNKNGNVTYFINNVIEKTNDELAKIKTIEELARLFVTNSSSDVLENAKTIEKVLKYAWGILKRETNDETGNKTPPLDIAPVTTPSATSTSESTNQSLQITPRKQIVDSFWKSKTTLVEEDSYWNIPNLNYSHRASKGIGKHFYKDIAKTNGKWNVQFNLTDWIDIYDTRFEEITSDPNHIYKTSEATGPGATEGYWSNNKGFYQIYNDKNAGNQKTGNNNNGLRGLYSGALFEAKYENGKRKKTFDIKSIISYNGKEVVLKLSKKSKVFISNGWEHVVPASKSGEVFGQNRKKPKTNDFRYSLGDFHNIRPSLYYHFNGPRSNYRFGIVPGNNNKYYGVDFEIGKSRFNLTVVEPRISVRGDIARIIFYMHDRYHIKFDLDYYKLLLLWARMDPVTPEEIALDTKIKNVMGFSNGYVTGAKKLPYDKEVQDLITNANNKQFQITSTPKATTRLLWSKKPHILDGAIYVPNPIDTMKVQNPVR